jgi:signal transduction histidine kinase
MKPRQKQFFTYFLLCLVPLLLLAAFNYWIASSLYVQAISDQLQETVNALAVDIDEDLRREETEVRRLASSGAVRQFVTERQRLPTNSTVRSATTVVPESTNEQTLIDLRVSIASLLNRHGKLSRVMLFDANGMLLQAERSTDQPEFVFRTNDLPAQRLSSEALQHDEFTRIPKTTTLRFAVPVSLDRADARGALVGELDLDQMLKERARRLTPETTDPNPTSMCIVWDADGKLLYHPKSSDQSKLISDVFPELSSIAGSADRSSLSVTHFKTSSGAVYSVYAAPLPRLGVMIALARNTSDVVTSGRKWGLAGFGLAIVFAFAAALLLESFVHRKTSGLERVTKGLTAVAKGELDHRVELRSSDEARAFADDLHLLTERLRSQLAREAETQQFESFFRLSAMLTHDLKNAIEALSLTVGNMERHFDNEQFRADAMKSLTIATNRLKALVARLSRPVTSLSGEHKLPVRVNLVPVLKRAIHSTVEPVRDRHSIELRLPDLLFAVTDERRIEEVFENLLLNSLEAMSDKNGKLTVEAEALKGESVVKITDNGCGMSESFIKNSLFHPFKTTKKNGIGLGLYTCREVIQASAGRIEVESAEGIGTTFRIVLPSGT